MRAPSPRGVARLMPALAALAVLLAGCTVGPDYRGAPRIAGAGDPGSRFVRAGDPAFAPAPGLARWWEALGDPTLTALIDDALAHSPTIDAATARIRASRAQLRQQQAGLLPSAQANATYLHAELPGVGLGTSGSGGSGTAAGGGSSLDFYNLGLNASWEPDLFGGGRRGVEQARATVGQRFAELADAQVSLTAQVAQAYVDLRDVQERQRITARSSALQAQALALTRQRFAAGTASALDVERLSNQLESTDAQNRPLQAQRDEHLNALAVLTGRAPGALDATLAPPAPLPLPPAAVAIGDPAALIAHRPDVRAAERQLAADTAAIGVNKAKLLPSLRFMGILGLGGTHPGDVFDLAQLTTLVAPMLSWNLLDFGKTQAAVRQSEAQRDEAQAQYAQKLLAALQDAETGLSRFGAVRLQLAQLLRAAAAADRAAALNRQRLAAGTSSLIDQLDIERQQLQAALAVAQAKAQLTTAYVGVQKSLGLGWSEPATTPARQGIGRTPGSLEKH